MAFGFNDDKTKTPLLISPYIFIQEVKDSQSHVVYANSYTEGSFDIPAPTLPEGYELMATVTPQAGLKIFNCFLSGFSFEGSNDIQKLHLCKERISAAGNPAVLGVYYRLSNNTSSNITTPANGITFYIAYLVYKTN